MKREIISKQGSKKDTQKDPLNGSCGFTRSVISSTHFVKTGKDLGGERSADVKVFADQKAKKMILSGYSFPVYIIRKFRQRSSYSDMGGDKLSPSYDIDTEQ